MSIYDKASLVLIPSGTKTSKVYSQKPVSGDGDFTFSRSTAATRVNADGVIEKETQNLLLQSNSFDTTWLNVNTSETGGQSGYDGSSDAWLISTTAANGRIYQNITTSAVKTFSVYAKAGSLSWMRLRLGSAPKASRYFDLTNGVIGTGGIAPIDATITSVGGGWYRCSITTNISIDTAFIYPANGDNDLSATSGNIYIQDAQLEQGLVARDYIETTTTAVEGGITDNVPRLDYTDSSCPALLLEPQRTNDVEHSEYFEGSGWGLLNSSLTANDSNSPEGLQNAYSFVPNTTNTTHLVYETITKSAGTYTASCFFKADGYDYGNIRLATDSDAKRYSVTIDLTDGTFASQDTYGSPTSTGYDIEDIGNGWYRLSVTSAHTSGFIYHTISVSNVASPTYSNGLPQFAGDGTKGVLIYGAQLEAGSYATSYIPTYGSAVTRNQDTGSIPSASSLIGQTEGTLFVKFKYTNEAVGLVGINAGNIGNRLYIGTDTNGLISQVRVSYSTQAFFSTLLTIGTTYKCALAYKENDFVLYVNGSQIGVDTNGLVPSSLSRIAFQQANDTTTMAQPLSEVLVFKTRLSNEELATLTTI